MGPPDGGFYRSPSQKQTAEKAQRKAEQRAANERRARDRAERATYTPPALGWRERVALLQEAKGA
jgi:hypothetical protein